MTEEERQYISRLYCDHFEKLYFYAVSCVGAPETAEDLVIETFFIAIKKSSVLISHPNPGGWLRNTLKFEIKMYFRNVAQTPQTIPYDTVSEHLSTQSTALDEEEISLLIQSRLTEQEQEECRLHFEENLTHSQVAEKLGITVSASQKQRQRLRSKLKMLWKGHI